MTSKPALKGSKGSICCVLPPEVVGLILSHLEDEERCRVIPPLCKEMYRIHREYPPPTKRWIIDNSPKQPMVRWCSLIAPSLEKLLVDLLGDDGPGLMLQMLMAAQGASNLRNVSIMNMWDSSRALLGGLTALTQLTKLKWSSWKLPAAGNIDGIELFSRLHSLQEIHFDDSSLRQATVHQGDILWKSLAALRNLNMVQFHVMEDYEDEPVGQLCPRLFLQSLSLLTQISALLLYNIEDCLEADGLLPASLCTLTQLTGLTLCGGLSSHSVRHAVSLPHLRELSLMIHDWETVPLSLWSDSLTKLRLMATGASISVNTLLRPSGPCSSVLQRLQYLDLSHSGIKFMSDALADSLSKLTHLSMRENGIFQLPPGIIRMKCLQTIDVRFNHKLHFQAADLKLIAALQHLQRLVLDSPTISRNSGFVRELLKQQPPDFVVTDQD